MISNRLTKLFQKRCPLCKAAVQEGAEGAVRRFGKRFCSQAHADQYERKRRLDKAFDRLGCGGGLC